MRIFDIQPFLLPAPSEIWSALVENADEVWDAWRRVWAASIAARDGAPAGS